MDSKNTQSFSENTAAGVQQPVQQPQYQQPAYQQPQYQQPAYQQPAYQQPQYQQPAYQQPVQQPQYQQPTYQQPQYQQPAYQQPQYQQPAYQQPAPKKSGKMKFVFIGIAGVALIGVIVAVVLYLMGNKKGTTATPSAPANGSAYELTFESTDNIIINGSEAIIAGYSGIYKGTLTSDGTLHEKERITDYIADSMCLVGNTLYFINGSMLGSLEIDGSYEVKSICDIEYSSSFGSGFYYYDGYIYLHDTDYRLCRVNVQTGEMEILSSYTITDFIMVGEQIYYYAEDNEEIFRINLDGSNSTMIYDVSSLTAGTLMRMEYQNDMLYFTCIIIQDDANGTGIVSVYQYDIASDTSHLLNSEDGGRIDSRNLQVDDQYLYISEENATTIAKISLASGNKYTLYYGDFYVFTMDGDYLYTWDYVTGDTKRMEIHMIQKDNGANNMLSTIE